MTESRPTTSAADVDQAPPAVEALARLISAAEVSAHGGQFAQWAELTASDIAEYRHMALYLTALLHITPRVAAEQLQPAVPDTPPRADPCPGHATA